LQLRCTTQTQQNNRFDVFVAVLCGIRTSGPLPDRTANKMNLIGGRRVVGFVMLGETRDAAIVKTIIPFLFPALIMLL
jgi:hypothetical protein